ncbi:MAG TPA: alpha/beta fold hydrolase [Steroidobacteraceae bacterium]|nr:alpha/beta fold hydrolase [Steroidobacteraceae bacterium]
MSAGGGLPSVFLPGLLCTPRLYSAQLAAAWAFGPVLVANHTRDDTVAAIARRVLATAPQRFALIGLSMGGYISLEIMRQAPERVAKLALLDTSARADTPEQSALRRDLVAKARTTSMSEVADLTMPNLLAPQHLGDESLRQAIRTMAEEVGAEAFARQQNAIMTRPDSRPSLGAIRCPTLVLVGEQDALTPPDRAQEIAAGIAGSRLVTVPRCGHVSTLERPDEVSRALVELLNS